MTDRMKNEIKITEEQRLSGLDDVEKFKKTYAKYIISDQEKIKEQISHPYVITKKDVRRKNFHSFLNNVKKAFGL